MPLIGQKMHQDRTINVGPCGRDLLSAKGTENRMGCRVSALAISPKETDLAIAPTSGDIFIHRLVWDRLQIPERPIRIDCVPVKRNPNSFGLLKFLKFDTPSRCSVSAMRFGPNGITLAALMNDERLRVFRINNGPARLGDGAVLASIPVPANVRVEYFGFDADDEKLIVVFGNGVIRWFDLIAPGPESVHTLKGFIRNPPPPSGLGGLRGMICERLRDHPSPLTELSEADFKDIRARFPGLGLSETDRRPCAQL